MFLNKNSHLKVRLFDCSIVRLFNYSIVQLFGCSIFLLILINLSVNSPAQTLKQEKNSEQTLVTKTSRPHQLLKPSSRAKNVILMIGDGMGISQITAGMVVRRDELNLERCKVIGLSKTFSASNLVTDSAAGATAFSIGKKTFNGAIGVDKDTIPQKTILEMAEKNGLATGLVVTCSVTHATPASFIAHQNSRSLDEDIALDFMKTDVDVFIGGGRKFFEKRKDGKNLLDTLKSKGYQITENIENVSNIKEGKLAGFVADEHLPKVSEGRRDYLSVASETAITILNKNSKGFFMMIEGSQIDWGGHEMNSQYIINEMIDFDDAIGKVLDFAEKDGNTLVIITADHECGGYAITNGNREKGEVEAKFIYNYHTAQMVPVFAFGPGAEQFSGIYENTEIFQKMISALGIKK